MVASRTFPATIDLSTDDEPLADALRTAVRGDQPVQLTDGGQPLAEITPLRPAEPAVDIDALEDNAEPDVFDPEEHERVMERRNRLRAEFAKLDIPPFSAVDWVRDARRDD